MHYGFEWDDAKEQSNERKHGVSFDEAATCFLDVFAIERFDVDALARRGETNERLMKSKRNNVDDDPLDREIDFSNARPNPYWLGVVDRRCVRVIDKDLTELFPDDESVNAALRAVADAAKASAKNENQRAACVGSEKALDPAS